MVEEARRGAAALGHVRGPCYSQVALGPRGCFLFETAARLGGGFDADVTRLASGVDLYDRVVGVALGDAALEQQGVVGPSYGGAIAKFLVARPGRVRAVEGLQRGARPRRGRRRRGVRARWRARPAADGQREARGVRAVARGEHAGGDRRAPTRRSRCVHASKRGDERRVTPDAATNGTGSSGVWQLFKERRSRATRSTATRRTGTRARPRGTEWRGRSGPPTRSTPCGTSGSASSWRGRSAT